VLATFVSHTDKLVDLYIDGELISTTSEHPFWTPDKGWVEAKDLVAGSLVQNEEGKIINVDRVDTRIGDFTVYNFKVEGFHTYFVSEHHLLVHNAAKDCSDLALYYLKKNGYDGQIYTIRPKNGEYLPAPQNGYPEDVLGWVYHDVYVKEINGIEMVYDKLGLGNNKPIPFDEWLSHYGDSITQSFGPRGK
jgi:Pretoxin HINT domain